MAESLYFTLSPRVLQQISRAESIQLSSLSHRPPNLVARGQSAGDEDADQNYTTTKKMPDNEVQEAWQWHIYSVKDMSNSRHRRGLQGLRVCDGWATVAACQSQRRGASAGGREAGTVRVGCQRHLKVHSIQTRGLYVAVSGKSDSGNNREVNFTVRVVEAHAS